MGRFASASNARLPRFDARFRYPGCETANTFTANWGNCFNWLCPPISMIEAVIKHLRLCKGRGVLLVPEWPSSYYWPLLTPNGKEFYAFVQDYVLLDPYYINNSTSKSVFNGFARFRTIALLLQFWLITLWATNYTIKPLFKGFDAFVYPSIYYMVIIGARVSH